VLKAQILSAIAVAKSAVQDLAVVVQHVKRGAVVHVPGTAPVYPETLTSVSVVFTKFDVKDIDGQRVIATDWKGLVFPETGLQPLPNDVLRVPTGLTDIAAGDYRILDNDQVNVGDTVALHQLHLRKT
jgi:hypothetical protein